MRRDSTVDSAADRPSTTLLRRTVYAVEKAAPLAAKVKTMGSEKIPAMRGDKPESTGTADSANPAAKAPASSSPPDDEADTRGGAGSTCTGPIVVTPAGMDEEGNGSHLPPRGTFSPTQGIF